MSEEKISPTHTRILMKRLLTDYVRHHRSRIGLALLCMSIVAASTVMLAKQMEPIIDDIFLQQREDLLLPIALGVLGIFVIKGAATFGQSLLMQIVGLRIVATIQDQLFARLVSADMAFFHSESPGNLISRFMNDVNMLRNVVSTTLTSIGKDTFTAIGLIGMMFYQDWLLATVAFIAFPTAILPISRTGKRMRKVSRNMQNSMGNLTTRLDEAFQGIRHVKAYGMEKLERDRVGEAVGEVRNLHIKAARTGSFLSPVMETLGGFAIAVVVLYGGSEVIQGNKEPGAFFSFITALLLAYEPIKKLSKLNNALQTGLAAADRVYRILDSTPEIQNRPDATELVVTQGQVEFRNVTFAYEKDKASEGGKPQTALNSINLVAPSHKTIALVGASGAGKTSILNLIPRFYDVTEGTILIDGQDVRDVSMESLRNSLALVSQETQLFDDTIRANIAYGRMDAGEEEIIAAAKAAHAHDFIMSLPDGYDTEVGPRGSRLSGGQRQRVSIARAMIRNAPILLLDEATSALDTESERRVQEALKTLMEGRTTFVIAHRLSTIVDADIIYVMDQGQIVEQGTHAELLKLDGIYSRLSRLQQNKPLEQDLSLDVVSH
ncbi:ABC transporter ATP-binding protein [Kiloniella sp. b19]|uniref:ABC transporter ATP-binding protein n=1 Tax=Kiloniella sp. GXU_MW_B19 TaxID=3141326 RepID=UPI0031DA1D61